MSIFSLAGASLELYVSFNTEENALGKRKQPEVMNVSSTNKESLLTEDQSKILDEISKTLAQQDEVSRQGKNYKVIVYQVLH